MGEYGVNTTGKWQTSAIIIFIVGGGNILLGLAAVLNHLHPFFQKEGFGWGSLLWGVALLFLGMFVIRKSRVALGIIIIAYVLDSVHSLLGGDYLNVGYHAIFLYAILQGFFTPRVLPKQDVELPSQDSTSQSDDTSPRES